MMKKLNFIIPLIFGSLALSNSVKADKNELNPNKGIELVDIYNTDNPSDESSFDIGDRQPTRFSNLLYYVLNYSNINDDAKVEFIASHFNLNRLDFSDNELLERYNNLMNKVENIVLNPNITAYTDYPPTVGRNGMNGVGDPIIYRLLNIDNKLRANYDFNNEKLYFYDKYSLKCDEELYFKNIAISVNLPNCKNLYINISKEQIKSLLKKLPKREVYNPYTSKYREKYFFHLKNENKIRTCHECSLTSVLKYRLAARFDSGKFIIEHKENPNERYIFDILYDE